MGSLFDSVAFAFGRVAGKRARASCRRTRNRSCASHPAGFCLESLEPRHALAGTDSVPGDSSTTETIQIGGTRSNAVNHLGDHDWYRVSLVAGIQYKFTLNATVNGPGQPQLNDPFLRLRFNSGFILNDDDDSGGNHNSKIETGIATSGTYFLDAGGFRDQSTGGYTLTVTQLTPTPKDDFSSDTSTLGSIQLGSDGRRGRISGTIETTGDRDWIRVLLEAGKTYRFWVNGVFESGPRGPIKVDMDVHIRNRFRASLAYNNNWSVWSSGDSRVVYRNLLPKAQVFYIDVGRSPVATGPTVGRYDIFVEKL